MLDQVFVEMPMIERPADVVEAVLARMKAALNKLYDERKWPIIG